MMNLAAWREAFTSQTDTHIGTLGVQLCDLLEAAQNEIKNLDAERIRLLDHATARGIESRELRAENERLREVQDTVKTASVLLMQDLISDLRHENERLDATIKAQDERIISQQAEIYRLWNALYVLYTDAKLEGPAQTISAKALALAREALARA